MKLRVSGSILAVLAASLTACAHSPSPEANAAPLPTGTNATPSVAPAAPSAPSAATPSSDPKDAPEYIRAAVAAPDRSDADRALDAGRHPDEMLAFFKIAPGQRVAELGAGGGYTAELLARVVGERGAVFAQNSKFILERFAEKPWSERLQKPVLKNVTRVDRDFDDPLPAQASNLDAVLCVLFYHDTVWQKVDRQRMNRAVFAALRSGGIYGIVDHSAKAGSGLNDVESLHRIDENALKEEVQRAGFVLEAEASFLRNPADTRDWNDSPRTVAPERRGTSDRFVLRFRKP